MIDADQLITLLRNSIVWVKTRYVSEDTRITVSCDSASPLKNFPILTFNQKRPVLTSVLELVITMLHHVTWPKCSCFQKQKYMDYNRTNRVHLLLTHLRGPLDSVVLFDLWYSLPDQHSAVCQSHQSHWCFVQAFCPSILCLLRSQGHADCEITWQSKVKITSNI